MIGKRTVFLAGDSTAAAYGADHAPQCGWGQVLYRRFEGSGNVVPYASESAFPQSVCYDLDGLRIDNRAMAGRSSRSFREEGRLADIGNCMKEGDFLFVQFAHNDANREKTERYVAPGDFGDSLMPYVELCREKGAVCVLVTAIAMREFGEDGRVSVSFPEYREEMRKLAEREALPLLDLGAESAELCSNLGPDEARKLFLWVESGDFPDSAYADGAQDNAHLKRAGAEAFAGLLAGEIRAYDRDCRLDYLKMHLKKETE